MVRILRRIRVARGGKFYLKPVTGGKLLNDPRVKSLAKKHGLKPSKALLRGCYSTWYGPGGKYVVWNKGNPKVVIRRDYLKRKKRQ